jgi:D,D-heptose 1,7-bisphosphate phosphatase
MTTVESTLPLRGCQAVILAGGKGTRLRVRTGDSLPKPMAPILGLPVLAHQIELCRRHGFIDIALLVHFQHEVISSYFGDGSQFGVRLTYVVEREPRGTAGALRDALHQMDARFLVLYGDTYADINLRKMWQAHAASASSATLLLHPNDHPHDSDLVEADEMGRIRAVHGYPHPEDALHANLVNAGLYVLEREGLAEFIPTTGVTDLAKHTFPSMLKAGQLLHAYVTPEYIKDMGTPERLDKVERDILSGVPERLSGRRLRSAIFLDRDGTINEEVNHLCAPEQLRLIPGAAQAIRSINLSGRLAVVVTNQPVVARGDVTRDGLKRIHAKLDHLLGEHRAYLDRLYACPHHPDRGFLGEVPELKVACGCRKPRTGLIDQAVQDLEIDRTSSWMVGDTSADMLAGALAGLRTVLVRTGHCGLDGKHDVEPHYVVPNLSAAIDWILQGHQAVAQQLMSVIQAAKSQRLLLVGGAARAGKSLVARVLSEQLSSLGKTVHVVSMDGWLKPVHARNEGGGVMARYDLAALKAVLGPLMEGGEKRFWFTPQCYERKSRTVSLRQPASIGPEDIVILEGVPALMDEDLVRVAAVRVLVEADEDTRLSRFQDDYAWRDVMPSESMARWASRLQDEWPQVGAAAVNATHRVTTS